MATINLLPYIATLNAFAKREERVPVWIHSAIAGYEIPASLTTFVDRIEDYLNGIRLFGQEKGRKEDGYGERTYHLKDLEDLINIFRSIGLAKSYPDFMQDFKAEDGWDFPKMVTTEIEVDGHAKYKRDIFLEGKTLEEIANGIKAGMYAGIDCVDYSGVVHRNCSLLRINDLHPALTRTIKQLDETGQKYIDVVVPISGVDSDLYLIITPTCNEKGWTTPEGETEPTLQASPFLRTPLGFVTMRLSRPGPIELRYPKGNALLKSLCPVGTDYAVFDKVLAKSTLIIQNTVVPGIIFKSIYHNAHQAFLTPEHLKAHEDTLDYLLSPEEEEDGFANVYKNWHKLTGQHYCFDHIFAQAQSLFKAVPTVIDKNGGRAGRDLKAALVKVVDIRFNTRWAIVGEFEAILNPNGIDSGTSSIKASNPVPYYIHTLNPETLEWEKDPVTKWVMMDNRGREYFSREEDPFKLVDVTKLELSQIKPLTDIYNLVERNHKDMVDSLQNAK